MKNLLVFLSGIGIGLCAIYLATNYLGWSFGLFPVNSKQEITKAPTLIDTLNRYQEDVVTKYDFDGLKFDTKDTVNIGKKKFMMLWSDEFISKDLELANWNINREEGYSWVDGVFRLNDIKRLTTKEKMVFDRGLVEVKCRIKKRGSINLLAPSSKIVLVEKHENRFLIGQYDMENEEKTIQTFQNKTYKSISDFFTIRLRFTEKYVEWYLDGKSLGKQERLTRDFYYLSIATYDENLTNAFEIDYVRYYVPFHT